MGRGWRETGEMAGTPGNCWETCWDPPRDGDAAGCWCSKVGCWWGSNVGPRGAKGVTQKSPVPTSASCGTLEGITHPCVAQHHFGMGGRGSTGGLMGHSRGGEAVAEAPPSLLEGGWHHLCPPPAKHSVSPSPLFLSPLAQSH